MSTLTDLLTVTGTGVVLHNALRFGAAKLLTVAKDVESGDAHALVGDARKAVAAAEKVDPTLVKAAEAEASKLKAEALAEVDHARHVAAETLRKLAEDVEKAATATVPAGSPAPPAVVQLPAATAASSNTAPETAP